MHDTASGRLVPTETGGPAHLYVCGITPYDAAHLGHANTYLAFDTLVRCWVDARVSVEYTQNTTDVDDPLLERAAARGVDWRELAAEQTELFRRDMAALGILPPDHFVAVTEVIGPIAEAVARLLDDGVAYRLGDDVYFDTAAAERLSPWRLGEESGLSRGRMLELAAERGGDPDRPGKRDPLDPLLWRGPRPGEPSWDTVVGAGRPGWHVECSVIAERTLGVPLTVQGGASDLVFPHHEFGAAHTAALTGGPLARVYCHAGLVAYRGEKMSKSLGNLVFVRELIDAGHGPAAVRLALLAHAYREDWEWTSADLERAEKRLSRWRSAARASGRTPDQDGAHLPRLLETVRARLADDLDTPGAVAAVDARIAAGSPLGPVELDAIDALLGVRLAD